MRRAALLAAAFLTAACAGPRPCTQTLCPSRLSGSYEVKGWSGTVSVSPEVPKPPVASDSQVSVLDGQADFTNGATTLSASAGTSFKFSVSSRAAASIEVSTGSVEVRLSSSSSAPTTVTPGTPYFLPAAR